MKICLFNPFSKSAAVRQYNLAKAFAQKGHQVTLVLPRYDKYSGYKKSIFNNVQNLEIVYPFQLPIKMLELNLLFYIPSAIWKLRGKKFEIVHGFRPAPHSGFLAWIVSIMKKAKFVFEIGDAESELMRSSKIHPGYRIKIVESIEKFLVKRAFKVTTMSDSLAEHIKKKHNCDVNIVHSGVDYCYFSKKIQSDLRKSLQDKTHNKNLILYLGKLDKVSHIKDLIFGFCKVNDAGLVIVGDGNGKDELVALTKKERIYERCFFAGRVNHENVPEYLQSADILVAPFSKSDISMDFVLNLKVIEYLSACKPIIVSNVGILKKVFGRSVVVYEPGDIEDFAEKIHYYLKNQNQAEDMGRKAQILASKFDWSILSDKMISLYLNK